MRRDIKKDVIIALDFPDAKKTFEFLDLFKEEKPFVKVGMELFYAEGPSIVREIKERGHRVFLDLKMHDIPNTVKSAMKVVRDMDVDMTNVHAGGTEEMMKSAAEGLERDGTRPILIAVTMLTSTSEEMMNEDIMIPGRIEDVVISYAKKAKDAGLDGVVCSPLEAGMIHASCGKNFLAVTPGVRFGDEDAADQKRVMTPREAAQNGSDYIVMGRPITKAEDPVSAYERAKREFGAEL